MKKQKLILFIVIIAALSALSPIAPRFIVFMTMLYMIFSIFALAYNILFGYGGLVSFGHSLFFAAGAYGFALMTVNYCPDLVVGIMAGVGLSLILSIAIGYLTVKHTRIYFAMLTFAFTMMFYGLLFKWRDVTGGSDGIAGIPRLLLSHSLSLRELYYVILGVFIISVIAIYKFVNSNVGLVIRGLGNNEERVAFSGYSILRYRLYAFIVSGVFSGLAGSLFAPLNLVVTPDLAYWTTGAEPLIMSLLGGPEFFIGPLIGALIYTIIHTYVASVTIYWQLTLGAILLGLVLGFRGGILGALYRLKIMRGLIR